MSPAEIIILAIVVALTIAWILKVTVFKYPKWKREADKAAKQQAKGCL